MLYGTYLRSDGTAHPWCCTSGYLRVGCEHYPLEDWTPDLVRSLVKRHVTRPEDHEVDMERLWAVVQYANMETLVPQTKEGMHGHPMTRMQLPEEPLEIALGPPRQGATFGDRLLMGARATKRLRDTATAAWSRTDSAYVETGDGRWSVKITPGYVAWRNQNMDGSDRLSVVVTLTKDTNGQRNLSASDGWAYPWKTKEMK